ncbi:MAG: peptide ABC transporter substrate-binding protein [Planctomycetaceae bacterium]|nr:peptide ABC transporter substrate-binding protein [Planctomycetaceae bacterium]
MAVPHASSGARLLSAAVLLTLCGVGLVALALRSATPRADFAFTGGGEVRSLDPHAVTGVPEGRVVRLMYEGLVARNPRTLQPEPAAAASWTVTPDGRTYTFTLRADARWSNGDPVVAEDFRFSFLRLLDPATASEYASALWIVEGAREYTTGVDASGAAVVRDPARVAIRSLAERTLEIRLELPAVHFLQLLAGPNFVPVHRTSLEAVRAAYPEAWASRWTRPENLVTNGPFRLIERRIQDRLRFERNEHYWGARDVALRTVDVLAIERWSSALNLYLAGELDWVDGAIPTSLVPELAGREDFLNRPYYAVYFYRVNVTRPPFDTREFRTALATSLQRTPICDTVLKAGQKPAFSLVPLGIGGYLPPKVFGESPEYGRKMLEAAGFDAQDKAKKPRPLELHFNTSEVHRDIAEVVADQWRKTLGLDVRLRNQEWKSFLDAQSKLDYDLSRSSWIADYGDPLSFLEIWTTGHENNRTGWSNANYDDLIGAARRERDVARRLELFKRAEQLLLYELPCIPIYHYTTQNLVDPRVGGFASNQLNEQDPRRWFWRDDKELSQARAGRELEGRHVESHGPRAGLHARGPAEVAK